MFGECHRSRVWSIPSRSLSRPATSLQEMLRHDEVSAGSLSLSGSCTTVYTTQERILPCQKGSACPGRKPGPVLQVTFRRLGFSGATSICNLRRCWGKEKKPNQKIPSHKAEWKIVFQVFLGNSACFFSTFRFQFLILLLHHKSDRRPGTKKLNK